MELFLGWILARFPTQCNMDNSTCVKSHLDHQTTGVNNPRMISTTIVGDTMLAAAYAHELPHYGLEVGLTNYAAAYCTGLLLARRVLKMLEINEEFQGIAEVTGEDSVTKPIEGRRPFRAVLDVGLIRTTTGNRVFGALKGALDGGLDIPRSFKRGQGALDGGLDIPHSDKRFAGYNKASKQLDPGIHHKYIFGGHVAAYMRMLMKDEPEKYQSHFSEYIKRGIDPDGIEELYKKVHSAIRTDEKVHSAICADPNRGSMGATILDLPVALLQDIFRKLTLLDRFHFRFALKTWKQMTEQASYWKSTAPLGDAVDREKFNKHLVGILRAAYRLSGNHFDLLRFPLCPKTDVLLTVAQGCPNVRSLFVPDIYRADVPFKSALTNWSSLEVIAFSENVIRPKGYDIMEAVASKCHRIVCVKLYCSFVRARQATSVAKYFKHIRRLDLSDCVMTTQALIVALTEFPSLTCLDITGAGCRGVTSHVLELANRLPNFMWDESQKDIDVCEDCKNDKSSYWYLGSCQHTVAMAQLRMRWSSTDRKS